MSGTETDRQGSSQLVSLLDTSVAHARLDTAAVPSISTQAADGSSCDGNGMTVGIEAKLRPITLVEQSAERYISQAFGALDVDVSLGLEERLPVLVQARLPECRHERETLLIDSLFEPDKVDSLPIMGQSPMKLLHERYKAFPSAVSNDELALLYASLCTASFQQTITRLGDDGFRHMMDKDPNEPREDVAYFDRAMKLLSGQYQASISSCWALRILHGWTVFCCGPDESRRLLQLLMDHVVGMGLHLRSLDSFYDPEDRVQQLFYGCFYSNTFHAGLCDEAPLLDMSAIDLDLNTITSSPDLRAQVTLFESELLHDRHLTDKNNTTSIDYIMDSEARWKPLSRSLNRHASDPQVPATFYAWARIRLAWLHILLRAPRLSLANPESSTIAVLCSAANRILRTYSDLASNGALNPSFPQLRRIVTAGQLVIICALEEQWYGSETHELLQLAKHLIGLHRNCWTRAGELSENFGLLADTLLLDSQLPPQPVMSSTAEGLDWTEFMDDMLGHVDLHIHVDQQYM